MVSFCEVWATFLKGRALKVLTSAFLVPYTTWLIIKRKEGERGLTHKD
jgi:hypothetical protein